MTSTHDLSPLERNARAKRLRSTIGAALMMFAFSGTLTSIGLLIPSGTARFHVPVSAYLLQYTILGIVGALMMPLIGRVVRHFGIRLPVLAASIWSLIWIVALSFTTELWQFYLFTVLWSLLWSFATVVPVTFLVNSWHQHSQRGLVFGLVMAGGAAGTIVWGLTMPAIVKVVGWEGAVRAVACIVFLCMTIPAIALIKDPPKVTAEAASKVAARVQRHLTPVAIIVLGAGLLSLEAGLTQVITPIVLSKGLDFSTAGLLVSYYAVFQMVLKPLGGVIFDKFGLTTAAGMMIVCYVVGFGALTFVTKVSGFLIVFPFAAMALTSHLVLLPLFVSSSISPERFQNIYGILMMVYYLGASLAAPLWGLGFDITGSYDVPLLVALLAGVVAVLLLLSGVRLASRPAARSPIHVDEAGAKTQARV
jgi:MFS family permease